jgi:hypothetical protein
MIDDARRKAASPDLAKRLRAEGFALTLAYTKDTELSETATAHATCKNGSDERKRSMQRERQRSQAERDASKWRRCYAKAPDDADARALVAKVARLIADPVVREAVRIAVESPKAALIGRRVLSVAALLGLPVRGR